ncbi:MAG TPA: DUF3662 domain-containing protein, partial [Thermoleophilia bacterium]|nr:DUF3662 domain-containing protein [Thermoleophilia bacterium]
MRKTESRVQRAFEGIFGRTFKGFVQPVELAQKLVKEMEEGRFESLSRTYAPNRFIVYLCRRDREHFRSHEASLTKELESHLLQHARSQKYDLTGPPEVVIASDDDLKLGFFGIRAEPVKQPVSSPVAPVPARGARRGTSRQTASASGASLLTAPTAPPPPPPAVQPDSESTQGIS